MDYAILSNQGALTVFKFRNLLLKCHAPKNLEYYKEIKLWDHGYVEVMTKYSHSEKLIEEYLDFDAALTDLGLDADVILDQIKEIRIGKVNEWGEVIEL